MGNLLLYKRIENDFFPWSRHNQSLREHTRTEILRLPEGYPLQEKQAISLWKPRSYKYLAALTVTYHHSIYENSFNLYFSILVDGIKVPTYILMSYYSRHSEEEEQINTGPIEITE